VRRGRPGGCESLCSPLEIARQRGKRRLDLGDDAAAHRVVVAAEQPLAGREPGDIQRTRDHEPRGQEARDRPPGKGTGHAALIGHDSL